MTVFLVRHANAGRRDDLDPDDHHRHLDDGGNIQAAKLVELLAPSNVTWIGSSPAIRCIETVEPLAESRELTVHRCDEIFEGSDVERAWDLLERSAHRKGDVVLCSHGDVIPELVRRAQHRGMEIPGKAGASKGSCWSLEWDGERFHRGVYTPIKP